MSASMNKCPILGRLLLVIAVCVTLTDGLSLSWVGVVSRDHYVHQQRRVIGTYYNLMGSSSSAPTAAMVSVRSRRQAEEESATPASIQALHVVSRVTSRFSETVVTSVVENPTQYNKEARFNLEIPIAAFISNFSMIIDGQLIVTQVKSKAEADDLYQKARQKNQTAGRVSSSMPQDRWDQPQPGMERFTISIAVKANSSIEFELTYLQLLERINGMYEQIISMRPGQIVPDFKVDVYVYDKQGVTDLSIFEPTVDANSLEYQIAIVDEVSADLQHVSFHPTPDQQRQMDPIVGVNRSLIVSYDVVHVDDGGSLQVEAGGDYFAHYFSPQEDKYSPLNKHIVFVIDISGSMSGRKMDQTRAAFRTIIAQLREDDTFLIMLFDDVLEYWPSWNEPVRATRENIQDAMAFAERSLYADGGTNIADAITTACRILRKQNNPKGSNLVMFLTDGEPTVGETSSNRIVAMALDAAANQVVIFSLAFGFSLDFKLLEQLAYRTGGGVKRIYEESDAERQLTEFYYTIGTPLMYDVRVNYPNDVVRVGSLTQTRFNQFFKGSEIVVVGQLVDSASADGATTLQATVTGEAKRGDSAAINEVSLTTTTESDNDDKELPAEVANQRGFIEQLYVYLRIKHLLKEKLVTDNKAKQAELENEALELALAYRMVTPLTSMIIIQPDGSNVRESAEGDMDLNFGTAMSHSSKQTMATGTKLVGVSWLLVYMLSVYQVPL